MYDRPPSIKSITSVTVITRRVVSIDFYRLIDPIDNDQVIDIDSYRFIDRFSDIDFYRLPRPGHFSTCFLDEHDPKLSRVKQEKNAMCTVYNEKHATRLAPLFSLS